MARKMPTEAQKRFRNALGLFNQTVKMDKRLNSTDKLVATHIAEVHLNRESLRAWPSNATVANAVGKHPKSVQRAVNKLTTLGHLRIERRSHRSNLYRFPLIEFTILMAADSAVREGRSRPGGGTKPSGRGGQECSPNLEKELNKKPLRAVSSSFVCKQRFGLNSPQARAWDRALQERRLGSLDDYDVTEVMRGDPDFVMPLLWPPGSDEEWQGVEEYLTRRRRQN